MPPTSPAARDGRSSRSSGAGRRCHAALAVSENWGFAAFETDRYRLVVDEDAVAPCQLFDLDEDPAEDHDLLPDPHVAPIVAELMETRVRPFFRTAPARPHPSLFTGGYDE